MKQRKKPVSNESSVDEVVAGRRVVTGFDSEGKSTILLDGPVPECAITRRPGEFTGHGMWLVRTVPADLGGDVDPMQSCSPQLEPPPGGVIARIVTYEPGFAYPMHKTETIDFGIVISGKLELVLENGSAVLGPGDCFVQRGTPHSWRVVGDEPCTFGGIMIDAKEPGGES